MALFTTSNQLRQELLAARERAAAQLDISAKRLLSDAALDAVMEARPRTELALRGIKGVGLRAAAVLAQDVARIFGSGALEVTIEPEAPVTVEDVHEVYAEPEVEDETLSVAAYLKQLNAVLGHEGAVVRGEVTEARTYPSGIYFSVKDATGEEGVLNCYLPPYRVRLFAHLITHGAELRLAGVPKISMRKGGFSFQVEAVEAVGEGALRAAYEQLKRDLAAEGLFDRALPIPVCAKRIGIITSRAGAVIDDFRKNLAERGYVMRMHDARVEGVRAVPSILGAIRWFMQHAEDIDVLVIMRGGGSLEDLQAFNNEQVARAIAALPMPVIAAIGHDRDVPITNMAADHSTSTPSIAALRINQSWEMADQLLARGSERLARGAHSLVLGLQRRVAISGERLVSRSALLLQRVRERASRATLVMQGYLGRAARLPDEHLLRITDAYRASVDRLRERLLAVERELAIVDPQRTLRLGYSILTDATGKAIKSVESLHAGDTVRTRLADGTATSTITHVQPET